MLYYYRTDFSEGIDVNDTSESKECILCHYWYFLDKGFKFQPDVYNRFRDVLMMSMNLFDTAILNSHCVDYRCIIIGITKNEAVNLLQKVDLNEKTGIL